MASIRNTLPGPRYPSKKLRRFALKLTIETSQTLARVAPDGVLTNPAILTGRAHTIVNVDLTMRAGEPDGAGTLERVDEVVADATVEAGIRSTFVDVSFTLSARETWEKREHIFS